MKQYETYATCSFEVNRTSGEFQFDDPHQSRMFLWETWTGRVGRPFIIVYMAFNVNDSSISSTNGVSANFWLVCRIGSLLNNMFG
jgi:hypothetical protein